MLYQIETKLLWSNGQDYRLPSGRSAFDSPQLQVYLFAFLFDVWLHSVFFFCRASADDWERGREREQVLTYLIMNNLALEDSSAFGLCVVIGEEKGFVFVSRCPRETVH